MNCICQDLDQYNMDKIKSIDSLLTFREDDDLATLDITVMRKFTLLTSNTIRHYKNLDSIDMEKFGKVIKLMENTVIVSTDIDMIAYYGKNPTDEKKKPTLDKLALVSDALEACSMIFEILTTCKLDKKFLSRNLITNCLHLIKNQLDYTVYPILDLDSFEDEATSCMYKVQTKSIKLLKKNTSHSTFRRSSISELNPLFPQGSGTHIELHTAYHSILSSCIYSNSL
jgi:hypothetical protein